MSSVKLPSPPRARLMRPAPEIGFDFGLMPAVFLGSLIGALWGGDFKLEGFKDGYSMRRYIVGAVFMGFGSMLAGGCAVIPGIDEVVATRTQVSTLVANPFASMVLSDRVRAKSLLADASALMVACGLALRRFDPS